MINFKKWISEEVQKKMRHAMPQLTDFEAFSKDLSKNGHELTDKTYNPNDLEPTQSNLNQEKIDRIKETWKDTKPKPIIVSNDDYVIDGHHRWAAAKQLKETVEARMVGMTAEELFEFLKDKPYVEKKSINESALLS